MLNRVYRVHHSELALFWLAPKSFLGLAQKKNHSCTPVVCWVSMATRVRSNENCSSSAICGLIDFALEQWGKICFEFPGLHVLWFMENNLVMQNPHQLDFSNDYLMQKYITWKQCNVETSSTRDQVYFHFLWDCIGLQNNKAL